MRLGCDHKESPDPDHHRREPFAYGRKSTHRHWNPTIHQSPFTMTNLPPKPIQPAVGIADFLRRSAALAVVSLALAFSSGLIAQGASEKETARMAGVLDLIDLDRSELEAVKAASEK